MAVGSFGAGSASDCATPHSTNGRGSSEGPRAEAQERLGGSANLLERSRGGLSTCSSHLPQARDLDTHLLSRTTAELAQFAEALGAPIK